MANTIEREQILVVGQRSPTAQRFLESLADRSHNRKVTTVEYVMARFKAPRHAVVDMFKAMADIGLGEFVMGRRTQPTRLIWTARMTDVGQAMIGELDEVEIFSAAEWDDSAEEIAIEEDDDFFDCYDHSFKLRAGFEPLTLSLPKDLTPQEADRIAAFIKTLPLG